MAEAVGLAASAVTLATLFSSCVECFAYFKAAQNCAADVETLLVQLDCEKARLLVWGNNVGILQFDPQSRSLILDDSSQASLIRRCIEQIIKLLTDAQHLQSDYGTQTANDAEAQHSLTLVSSNSMSIFQAAKRRFFVRLRSPNSIPSWTKRLKWAIRDAAKFRTLVLKLRDFVDYLVQLVPVQQETITETIEDDIASIVDIGSLRITERACEIDYPSWSERAKEAIRESEAGTLDRRNLEEFLKDAEPFAQVSERSSNAPKLPNDVIRPYLAEKTLVVLTDTCLNQQQSYGQCSNDLGKVRKISFCSPKVQWKLGQRVLSQVVLSDIAQERIDRREQIRSQEPYVETKPAARVFIHCGPCACAIATAQQIIQEKDVAEYLDVVLRIDDRLPTSCQTADTAVGVLEEIRQRLDEPTKESMLFTSSRYIDQPALERRIYDFEEDKSVRDSPSYGIQRILEEEYSRFASHSSPDLELTAVVFVAESDLCSASLEAAPFLRTAKKPQATEIYTFSNYDPHGPRYLSTSTWRRVFLGRYSRSKLAKEQANDYRAGFENSISRNNLNGSASAAVLVPAKRPREE